MLNQNIRRCAYIKTNGTQCGSPAARGHELCHFHWRAAKDFPRRRSTPKPIPETVIDLTLIDSPDAIHYALMQVAQGVANRTLTDKESGRLTWILQVMSSNFKQTSFHRQLEDEYSSSNLNCYQIWDKVKQEFEDKQRTELHEKRLAELKRLEKTCCKCHQVVEDESQLTSTAPSSTDQQQPPTTNDQPIPTIKASADSPIVRSSVHPLLKSPASSAASAFPFAPSASFALSKPFKSSVHSIFCFLSAPLRPPFLRVRFCLSMVR